MKINTDLKQAAHEYADKGIPVFPLSPKTKDKPVVKWGSEATTDLTVNNDWWTKNPNYNIAIVTGQKSGIVVLDFDTEEAWNFGKEMGLPDGPTVRTGRGYHVYCKYQEGVRNFQKRADLPGIDLRGEGGYAVAPPSIHAETGNIYTWLDGKGFIDLELPPLPEWVFAKNASDKKPVAELISGVDDGERNDSLTRITGSMLSEKFTYDQVMLNSELWNEKNEIPLPSKELVDTINSIYKREHGSLPEIKDTWQEPILFEGIETPEITADILPSWLGEYSRAVSQFTQTPEALAVMVGLSTLSTSVQKRFEVAPYGDDYRETLSLWTVTVLPPSERKTPVLVEMTRPIYEWESDQARFLESTIKENSTNRAIIQKRIEKLTQKAANADDPETRSNLTSEIIELQNSLPEEIREPKLCTGDVTPERLQDLMVENGERMALISDEGGIFEIMGGLYSDGKVNIDVFLQGYSGSPIRVDRKNRSSSLSHPALVFGLTIQPSVMESFSCGSKKAFRGKGALARFLYCLPQGNVGKRDITRRMPIPQHLKNAYFQNIERLLVVPKQTDNNGNEIPRILTLDFEALGIWEDFSQQVERMLGYNGQLEMIADWGGKLPGNALRIAGLMHLAEYGIGSLVICKDTVEKAIELCKLLITHAKAAFAIIGTDETVAGAKKLFKWIEAHGFKSFTKHGCHRSLHGTFNKVEQLEKPLKVLEERHIIKENKIKTTGRPSVYYEVNPYFMITNI